MRNFIKQKNPSTKLRTSRGFGTLLIVILLGGVAFALTLTLSTSSIWSIRGSIDSKTSNAAKSLANACAEVALEAMRENNSYAGAGNVTLNGNTCSYTVANTGGATRSISVIGVINDITRKLSITTNSFNPLTIVLWQETP